jgi:hypothetical protein
LKVVAVRITSSEAGAISGLQEFLAAFRYENNLALKDLHELILC